MPVSASRSLRYIQNATLSKALLDIFGRKVGEYFCNRPPLWQSGSRPHPFWGSGGHWVAGCMGKGWCTTCSSNSEPQRRKTGNSRVF